GHHHLPALADGKDGRAVPLWEVIARHMHPDKPPGATLQAWAIGHQHSAAPGVSPRGHEEHKGHKGMSLPCRSTPASLWPPVSSRAMRPPLFLHAFVVPSACCYKSAANALSDASE